MDITPFSKTLVMFICRDHPQCSSITTFGTRKKIPYIWLFFGIHFSHAFHARLVDRFRDVQYYFSSYTELKYLL